MNRTCDENLHLCLELINQTSGPHKSPAEPCYLLNTISQFLSGLFLRRGCWSSWRPWLHPELVYYWLISLVQANSIAVTDRSRESNRLLFRTRGDLYSTPWRLDALVPTQENAFGRWSSNELRIFNQDRFGILFFWRCDRIHPEGPFDGSARLWCSGVDGRGGGIFSQHGQGGGLGMVERTRPLEAVRRRSLSSHRERPEGRRTWNRHTGTGGGAARAVRHRPAVHASVQTGHRWDTKFLKMQVEFYDIKTHLWYVSSLELS